MRRLLSYPTWMLLAALVAVSASLRDWAAGAIPTPWIAPDELFYGVIGRTFWETGHFELLHHPISFFSFLYPALAGLPLSFQDREAGYEVLKALQAILMSLTAVPVYLWGRELVSRGWALVAAVLALAPPALAYSGLIMTEVAFYPAFVVAAWAIARAIARPTVPRQALMLAAIVLACAVRLQAIVLLPAYLTAVAVDAALARSRRHVLPHVRAVAALAAVALLWGAWQLRHGGSFAKVLAGYQAAGETHYDLGAALRFVLYHLGDVVLISGVVPFCAVLVLAARAATGKDRGDSVRAYVAVAVALTAWLPVEVGVFASRHVGYLAERNLSPLIPVLVLGFVTWLATGAPRPRVAFAAAAVLALLLLVAVPLEQLTTLAATPSGFTQIPLLEVTKHVNLDFVVPAAAAVLLAACAFAPPRVLFVGLPLLLLGLGAAASVSASRFIAHESRGVALLTLQNDKQWVEPRVDGPVTYIYSGYLNWESVWQTMFWNPSVTTVYDLLDARVPGAIPQKIIGPMADGAVYSTGDQVDAGYVLADEAIALVGRQLGVRAGLVLWKVERPLRFARWMIGVAAGGSVPSGKAELRAYACTGGRLSGQIVTTQPQKVEVLRNDRPERTIAVKPGVPQAFDVPVEIPVTSSGRQCTITLRGTLPFAFRRLAFS